MEARINFRNILDKMIETSSEARKRSSVKHVNLRSRISVNDFMEFVRLCQFLHCYNRKLVGFKDVSATDEVRLDNSKNSSETENVRNVNTNSLDKE